MSFLERANGRLWGIGSELSEGVELDKVRAAPGHILKKTIFATPDRNHLLMRMTTEFFGRLGGAAVEYFPISRDDVVKMADALGMDVVERR